MNKKIVGFPGMSVAIREWSMRADRKGFSAFYVVAALLFAFMSVPAVAAVVPGSSPGGLSVSSAGAAQYTLPLTLPPGAGSVMPQLSFQYSSQGDNGLLGVGWSLGGLHVVARCSHVNGSSLPLNRFCLNGKRLIQASAGNYGGDGIEYRTEIDEFSRIVSFTSDVSRGPDSFKIWTKEGNVIELGNTPDSKLLFNSTTTATTPSGFYTNTVVLFSNQTVMQWSVNKVTDRKFNYYTIAYAKNDLTGEIYPDLISYTGNDAPGLASVVATNTVKFTYEARPVLDLEVGQDYGAGADYPVQYMSGSRVATTKRLKDVQISADGVLSRKYKLAYKGVDKWEAMRSRLESISECAYDALGAESCFNPTQFEMSTFDGCLYDSYKSTLASAGGVSSGTYTPFAQDFDGDGRADLVSAKIDGAGFKVLSSRSTNSVPTGTDFVDATTCEAAPKQGQSFDAAVNSNVDAVNHGASTNWVVTAGDVTGNGLPEVVGIPLTGGLNPLVASRQANGSFTLMPGSVADNSDYATTTHDNAFGTDRAWLADINGDGKLDLAAIKIIDQTMYMNIIPMVNAKFYYRLGNGDGTFLQAVRKIITLSPSQTPFRVMMGNMSGDTSAELIVMMQSSNKIYAIVYDELLVGNNWPPAYQPTLFGITHDLSGSFAVNPTLVDVNRDGAADLVSFWLDGANKAHIRTSLSRGSSFLAPDASTDYVSPSPLISSGPGYSLPWKTTFTDLNGDGRPDLVVTQVLADSSFTPAKNRLATFIFLNRGDGRFIAGGSYWSTHATDPALPVESNWVRLAADFDGDGLGDMASVMVNNTYGYQAYPIFPRSPLPDLLKKVIDGNGASTELVQAPLTRDDVYTKGTAVFPEIALRAPLYVVKTLKRDSGNGLAATVSSYTYTGAKVEVGPAGRGFLGFASSQITDPLGIVTATTFSQAFPYTGMPLEVSRTKGGVLLSTASNTVDKKDIFVAAAGTTTYFPFVGNTLAKQYEFSVPGSLASQTSTAYDFDAWGNLLSAVATTTGDGNTYSQTASNTYFPNLIDAGTWRIGELKQKSERRVGPLPEGETSDLTRTVAYTYDAVGLLATQDVEPTNPALRVTTAVGARDRFGNVLNTSVSGADIATRTESAVFDASGRFVTSKTNAEGHVTAPIVMDKRFGQPLSIKDPNGIYAERQYDDFGRLVREQARQTNPDGSVSDGPFSDTSYLLCDSSCDTAQGEVFMVRVTPQGAAPATAYYDRNGRERRKLVKGMDGSDIITAIEYDALGRVARSSRPYFSASSTIQWSIRSYDSIGRPATEFVPGSGTSTYAYAVRSVTSTNPKAQTSKQASDALGRLVATTDALLNTQTFAYDAFGNVARSTDVKGNVIANQYDLLGRKTQQQDPDMGTWNYQYDVLGQSVWQKDAKNQITTFTYDKLGRPLGRTESDQVSTWTWDTASKGIGKLAKLNGDSGFGFERNYRYDGFGRPVQVITKKTIDPYAQAGDPDFVHGTSYDSAGRPETVTYPTGFGYRNVYDSRGYLSEVRNKDNHALYWQASSRDAEGHVTRQVLGNGIVTDRKYKADSGYLETVQTGTLSGGGIAASVQNDAYSFDALGNLSAHMQYFGSTALADTFAYDSLNRVISATPVGGTAQTASYDAIGNISNRSDVGDYVYTGCGGAHRVCNVGFSDLMIYDLNGNMETGNGRSITWTSYNYPLKITQGGNTETFMYTPERERARRVSVDGGLTTETVYLNPRIDLGNTFEKAYKPGGAIEYTHHIYAGNQVIGSVVTDVPVTLWATAFDTAPTTVNPNPTGFTLPAAAADPNGLVTWELDAQGNGRMAMRSKNLASGSSIPVTYGQRIEAASMNMRYSFEMTTTPRSGGRYFFVSLTNNGAAVSKTFRRMSIGLIGADIRTYRYDGTLDVNGNQYDISQTLAVAADNTTYVVEVEAGATATTVNVYVKGASPDSGVSRSYAMDWTAGQPALTKRIEVRTQASTTYGDNLVYLDNFSVVRLAPTDVRYFHTNHLGSLVAVTNAAGAVVERLSYDAWGKRRNPDSSSDTCNALYGVSSKHGYTLHEHLDGGTDLVHMNGRVYDPVMGRFLSADPNVFYPENMQDFNRYSYVHNNPLSFIDPSGFESIVVPLRSEGERYKMRYPELGNVFSSGGSIDLTAQLQGSIDRRIGYIGSPGITNQHQAPSVAVGNGGGSSSRPAVRPGSQSNSIPTNGAMSTAGNVNDFVGVSADTAGGVSSVMLNNRAWFNKMFHESAKMAGTSKFILRAPALEKVAAVAGKFSNGAFVVGVGFSAVKIRNGVVSHNYREVVKSSIDLGVNGMGFYAGVMAAGTASTVMGTGALSYAATGLAIELIPGFEEMTVQPLSDFMSDMGAAIPVATDVMCGGYVAPSC